MLICPKCKNRSLDESNKYPGRFFCTDGTGCGFKGNKERVRLGYKQFGCEELDEMGGE